MKRTSLILIIILTFLFCIFTLDPSRAQDMDRTGVRTDVDTLDLFQLTGTPNSQSSVSIAGVQEQQIEINFAAPGLEQALVLRFPLLDGKMYEATRKDPEGFERFAPDEYTWRGTILGDNDSSGDVILTVKDKALSGLIYSPEGVYEIVPQKDFKHLLVLLDQSRFPACGGTLPAKQDWESIQERPAPADQQIALDDGAQLDVLVVYTAPVRTALGGTSQTQAFIQQAVAATNTAYLNSSINPRLRLVNTQEVSYTEDGTLSSALNWVDSDATVAAARNLAKADLVAIIIENASDGCGLGYVMHNVSSAFSGSAFSATARGCAVGNLSFAHELGHNEGCEHNPENGSPPAEASYPYAFGHYVNGSFRTVMSYSDPCTSGCTRKDYFSNPSVNFNGQPTGIANQRDNHRVINNTALIISQFRDSGGSSCTYSLNPTSRSFTASGGSNSVNVVTGSTCAWTATVNAPSSDPTFLPAPKGSSVPLIDALKIPAKEKPNTPQTVFLNSTPIAINDRTSNSNPPGTAAPYPSTINVSGMTGTITLVQAALNGVSHVFPDDIDVILVGPGGQRAILMSDVGGSADLSGVDLIFEQSAAAMADESQIVSGTYRPTNFNTNTTLEPGGVDNYPSPGPGQSVHPADLGVFNGTSPNGNWQIYVVDDEHLDSGNIATGWALGIVTSGGGTSWITITSGSSGTGNGTVNYTVAANSGQTERSGTITVNGQNHTITQAGSGGGCPSSSISPGQSANGSLATSDCIFSGTTRYVDLYNFNGTAGQQISVSLNSSAIDTYLYLLNASGQLIAEDDDSGDGTNSRIPASGSFTLPATGNYTIYATSYAAGEIGSYTLTIGGPGHLVSAGLFNPSSSTFFLRNSNSAGTANLTFAYGPSGAGWTPVAGDWDGNGTVTAGLYNPATSTFFLKNSNSAGSADLTFAYGPAGSGWLPIVGDWNGDGTDTVGLYQPSTATFFLKNSNSAGSANLVFSYGPAGLGWLPLAGDWNGDGVDTVGLYQPSGSTFFLKNTNSAGSADVVFGYGPSGAGWTPIAGDWNQDGFVTVGLYSPSSSTFFLKNTNSAGAADLTFSYGPAGLGWKPLAGDWDGL